MRLWNFVNQVKVTPKSSLETSVENSPSMFRTNDTGFQLTPGNCVWPRSFTVVTFVRETQKVSWKRQGRSKART